MSRAAGVYKITNTQNGKTYVGSSVDIRRRWSTHRNQLRKGTHTNPRMQRAWRKYGEPVFEISTLLICADKDLLFYEQRCLDALKPAYNICPKAGSALGAVRSPEVLASMSAALAGNTHALGYKHTPEAKARISAASAGHTYGVGRKQTPGAIAKISASLSKVTRALEATNTLRKREPRLAPP